MGLERRAHGRTDAVSLFYVRFPQNRKVSHGVTLEFKKKDPKVSGFLKLKAEGCIMNSLKVVTLLVATALTVSAQANQIPSNQSHSPELAYSYPDSSEVSQKVSTALLKELKTSGVSISNDEFSQMVSSIESVISSTLNPYETYPQRLRSYVLHYQLQRQVMASVAAEIVSETRTAYDYLSMLRRHMGNNFAFIRDAFDLWKNTQAHFFNLSPSTDQLIYLYSKILSGGVEHSRPIASYGLKNAKSSKDFMAILIHISNNSTGDQNKIDNLHMDFADLFRENSEYFFSLNPSRGELKDLIRYFKNFSYNDIVTQLEGRLGQTSRFWKK